MQPPPRKVSDFQGPLCLSWAVQTMTDNSVVTLDVYIVFY